MDVCALRHACAKPRLLHHLRRGVLLRTPVILCTTHARWYTVLRAMMAIVAAFFSGCRFLLALFPRHSSPFSGVRPLQPTSWDVRYITLGSERSIIIIITSRTTAAFISKWWWVVDDAKPASRLCTFLLDRPPRPTLRGIHKCDRPEPAAPRSAVAHHCFTLVLVRVCNFAGVTARRNTRCRTNVRTRARNYALSYEKTPPKGGLSMVSIFSSSSTRRRITCGSPAASVQLRSSPLLPPCAAPPAKQMRPEHIPRALSGNPVGRERGAQARKKGGWWR